MKVHAPPSRVHREASRSKERLSRMAPLALSEGAKTRILSRPDASVIAEVVKTSGAKATLVHADCRTFAPMLPEQSIDCIVTSPPYWSQRRYDSDSGIGHEATPDDYADTIAAVLRSLRPALKRTGSVWLNIGDTYDKKQLCGVPWRVALRLQAEGWILRNAVVWDKMKGNPDNAKDKLRNTYEMVFHFVQQGDYFYNIDAIRNKPAKAVHSNGRVATATGVTGKKYERQIQTSAQLSTQERTAALAALKGALERVRTGDLPDFRMVIRGSQRATHSADKDFSGRARELEQRGFYLLPYHKNGSKPGDIWRIVPEDAWRSDSHAAVYPIGLCQTPIRATSPKGGIILDPFVGTGTTIIAALQEGRRAIGIDTGLHYLATAAERLDAAADQPNGS